MNERVKKLWIDALRSGEYRQGRNALHPSGSFCCLGVLCDLYRKETGKGTWEGTTFKVGRYDEGEGDLPESVMEWAELDDENPTLGTRANSANAAALNDRGESFHYIADRIEKYL